MDRNDQMYPEKETNKIIFFLNKFVTKYMASSVIFSPNFYVACKIFKSWNNQHITANGTTYQQYKLCHSHDSLPPLTLFAM